MNNKNKMMQKFKKRNRTLSKKFYIDDGKFDEIR